MQKPPVSISLFPICYRQANMLGGFNPSVHYVGSRGEYLSCNLDGSHNFWSHSKQTLSGTFFPSYYLYKCRWGKPFLIWNVSPGILRKFWTGCFWFVRYGLTNVHAIPEQKIKEGLICAFFRHKRNKYGFLSWYVLEIEDSSWKIWWDSGVQKYTGQTNSEEKLL